jgi:hypothetical protein
MLRWDSATIAQAIGSDSLVEASLVLTIVANGGGWGGQGRVVGIHAIANPWTETGGWVPQPPQPGCSPWNWGCAAGGSLYNPVATNTFTMTNGAQGVVTRSVTSNVRAILTGDGPYVQGFIVKLAHESGSASVTFGSRESANPPQLVLTVLRQQTPTVPAVAPDTVPGWLYDFETSNSPVMSGTFLTNIVFVVFKQGTSQPERQAAVDLVGGTVVGGLRAYGDDGYYVVRIEDDHPTVPGQALVEALELLKALSQVALARPEFYVSDPEDHLRPDDGAGWDKAGWILRPADADGSQRRWGLVRIAAPLAWGCSQTVRDVHKVAHQPFQGIATRLI